MTNTILAAIDIGSHNCRLTIVKIRKQRSKVIHNFSYGTNLIKNLSYNNEFDDKNIKKTMQCLQRFSKKLIEFEVKKYRCIATEACRQVINPEFFVNRVKELTGISVEIISSYEEAKLSLKSCTNYINKDNNEGIIFDIGGGSTELTYFNLEEQEFKTRSLSYGVINRSEKIQIYGEEFVKKEINNHFLSFKNNELKNVKKELYAIGSCSTATTLCAIFQNLKRFDIKMIEGFSMKPFEMMKIAESIIRMDKEKLKMMPCVGSRYNLLLNGTLILIEILKTILIRDLIVTQKGLRDGILNDLILQYEKN
ncbi:MAG: hypothetical protein ACJ0G4_06430 [Alphaproteobacteria bacterium]